MPLRLTPLILFLLLSVQLHAQNVPEAEYPFRHDIEKGRYDKAEEKIFRRLSRDTNNLECYYAAYWLYSTLDFPRHNLDRAYAFIARVRSLYQQADAKTLERLDRDSYSGARIDYDIRRISNLARSHAHSINTIDAYQHHLDHYTLAPTDIREAVTYSRDSLEFLMACNIGTLDMLQGFINRRPDSKVRPAAIRVRDSLAFLDADRRHTTAAYEAFRLAYPTSHLYARATDSVYLLDYRDVRLLNTEQYYRSYARRYPLSPYATRTLWLADSIQYQHDIDTADWHTFVQYLDSRNPSGSWADKALQGLARLAHRTGNIQATQQVLLRLPTANSQSATLSSQLSRSLHHAYLHTSILNYPRFYSRYGAHVPDSLRHHDSVAYHAVNSEGMNSEKVAASTNSQFSPDSLIQLLAPYHEAYLLLQQRIADNLARHRFTAALATVDSYAHLFGTDPDYLVLRATLATAATSKNAKQPNKGANATCQPTNAPQSYSPNGLVWVESRLSLTDREVDSSYNLYLIGYDDQGTLLPPVELGPAVNTPFHECAPYLHPDLRTLYFASDGHGALGGLDIYVTTRLSADDWTHWSQPVSLGATANSPQHDTPCSVTLDGTTLQYHTEQPRADTPPRALSGYGSTTNPQSDPTVQITTHTIQLSAELRPKRVATLTGTLLDTDGHPIASEICCEDPHTGRLLARCFSNPNDGTYRLHLPYGQNYSLYLHDSLYYPADVLLDLTYPPAKTTTYHPQLPLVTYAQIITGSEPLILHNVIHHPANWQFDSVANSQLIRLADIINRRHLTIEIGSHVDGPSGDLDNQLLTQRRAEAIRDFLVQHGCNPDHITAVGYGSSRPIIGDNPTHQSNRRTEIRVIR